MNFKTIEDLNNIINKNIHKIPYDVDLIVGIPRSGLFVANLLALYLNLPLTDLDSLLKDVIYENGVTKKNDKWINKVEEARKILIVEDSSRTGNSIKRLKEKIKNYKYKNKIIILTVYVTNDTKNIGDMYFEICESPRMFEWNYMHNKNILNACFDIDGVLCVDPTEEENDDGEKYIEFIRNAPVRFIPTFTIGYLVTSRLEKYRADTEYWLKKNGIKYENLIMMQYDTKEERIKNGSHGKFKGEIYKKLKNANIFIESNVSQAVEISVISGKTVYCVDNQKVYEANMLVKTKDKIKKNVKMLIPVPIKKILKKILKGK